MRHLVSLLLGALWLSGLGCDEALSAHTSAPAAEEVTGLRYADVTCGNLRIDDSTLAFAAQSLDEDVFEVLLELDGVVVDWMGDAQLGIEGIALEDAALDDYDRDDLKALRVALDHWFDSSPQTVTLHEELLLVVIDRLVDGTELRSGQAGPWSLDE